MMNDNIRDDDDDNQIYQSTLLSMSLNFLIGAHAKYRRAEKNQYHCR